MPISDEFEEIAAPILYELVEKRGNNFQPWTGRQNYEPWRGKRSSGLIYFLRFFLPTRSYLDLHTY